MNQITLNFSNIKFGGAKQVALSFLMELKKKDIDKFNILVSKEVHEELISINFKFLNKLKIYNSNIFRFFHFSLIPEIKNAEIVFTLFGPLYAFARAKTITGFAQPWILYPDNLVNKELGFFKKLLLRLKFKIQLLFFKKDTSLVVESDVAKNILIDKLNFKFVNVVNNSLNTVFLNQLPEIKDLQKEFKIGVIGRNYPHKNLKILPQVLDIINEKFKVTFYVTLTDEEFSSMNSSFQKKVINYGSLKVSECPQFYDEMDLIFFPSLLEVFSATPLESLYMKTPFVCSDLPFNKGFLEDFVYYAKPNDVVDSANVISKVLELISSKDTSLIKRLNLGSKYVLENFQPSNRASAYLEIIRKYE